MVEDLPLLLLREGRDRLQLSPEPPPVAQQEEEHQQKEPEVERGVGDPPEHVLQQVVRSAGELLDAARHDRGDLGLQPADPGAQTRVALGQLLPEMLQLLGPEERLRPDPLQEERELPGEEEERGEHRHEDQDGREEDEERGGEGWPAAEGGGEAPLGGREEERHAGGHGENEEERPEDPEGQDEDDGEGEQERGEEVAAPSLGHGVVAAMVPRSPGGGAATRG